MTQGKKVAYVNAFIESAIEALEPMVGSRPRRSHVAASAELDSGYGSASIGAMVMTTCGPLILCFSRPVALRIMSGLTGNQVEELNNEVLDGTRELANILAGNAKTRLSSQSMDISFQLPQTRLGAFIMKAEQKPNDYWITIQFECDAGQFFIQVPFQEAFFEEPEEQNVARKDQAAV